MLDMNGTATFELGQLPLRPIVLRPIVLRPIPLWPSSTHANFSDFGEKTNSDLANTCFQRAPLFQKCLLPWSGHLWCCCVWCVCLCWVLVGARSTGVGFRWFGCRGPPFSRTLLNFALCFPLSRSQSNCALVLWGPSVKPVTTPREDLHPPGSPPSHTCRTNDQKS